MDRRDTLPTYTVTTTPTGGKRREEMWRCDMVSDGRWGILPPQDGGGGLSRGAIGEELGSRGWRGRAGIGGGERWMGQYLRGAGGKGQGMWEGLGEMDEWVAGWQCGQTRRVCVGMGGPHSLIQRPPCIHSGTPFSTCAPTTAKCYLGKYPGANCKLQSWLLLEFALL